MTRSPLLRIWIKFKQRYKSDFDYVDRIFQEKPNADLDLAYRVLYDLRWPCRPIKGYFLTWLEYFWVYGWKRVPASPKHQSASDRWTEHEVITFNGKVMMVNAEK